ncbi:hypothetical protein [Bradyrhizobium sp. G127]|uniref:hypothetical protein n=1 Tax=Bradyrhizobium sp. G127 TaxID=2904800 RepID=UPI001F447634|nr:hypothetical protein [Bradyrhizobium sp. G127]MCF2525399.1 hypothetical protein [Bradyrhizobium sp. G127]
MVVRSIDALEVLTDLRRTLGIPVVDGGDQIDDVCLAALVRRAAAICCPCSVSSLSNFVADGLSLLAIDPPSLREKVDEAVDGLLVVGDLLELNQVASDDPNVKGTWVFAAPPSFVDRKNGSTFIIGIAGDELSPLPRELADRVSYERFCRVIKHNESETLSLTLRDLGLIELSERAWLRPPKEETPQTLVEGTLARLLAQPPSGQIEEIQILDPEKPVGFYRGRWTTLKSQTGIYVARRPQAYGAPLWGVVKIESGQTKNLLDLPYSANFRWRGCDAAWHLQMAIDSRQGRPQNYRRRNIEQGAIFDFYSPLPLWAERRLAVIGKPTVRENCLISYLLPAAEADVEEKFLKERLWLVARDEMKN